MEKFGRIISLLLALALMIGVLPVGARAADAVTEGLLGASFDPDGTPISSVYNKVANTEMLKDYEWPDNGYIFVIATDRYPLSALNGVTVPPNLVLDVYRYTGGIYYFKARYDTTDGSSLTITDAESANGAVATVAGFSDVLPADYYASAVKWAKNSAVTTGTTATTFSPRDTVIRAEAVTFLWRAMGCPEPSSADSPFEDVSDPELYYYKPVLWAVEQGITKGVGDDRFDLYGTLEYDQILTFLCRAAGVSADGDDWSDVAVDWAAENGLTDGLSFTAKRGCPRSDVVYFLWNQLADKSAGDTAAKSDREGAVAAIKRGLLRFDNHIDLNAYNLSVAEVEELAKEYVLAGGEAMFVNEYRVNENPYLKNACSLTVEYETYEQEELEKVREKVKAVSAEVITPGMSEYDKALALHDWLVLNCAYDMRYYSNNVPNISYHSPGAMLEGTSVCAGYAWSYRALLRYNGIKCVYIDGSAGGAHAWNLVNIDGEWYHVDTTWDDPTPNKEGYVRYKYFLKSDSYMSGDHSDWDADYVFKEFKWTEEFACTSTKYDEVMPSSEDKKKQEEQKQKQEQEDAAVAAKVEEIIDLCCEALGTSTVSDLVTVIDPTTGETEKLLRISYDLGKCSYASVKEYLDEINAAIGAEYPGCEVTSMGGASLYVRSQTLSEEWAQEQAESDARVAEIEEILKDAIRNGDVRQSEYRVSMPSGYTSFEADKAVKNMNSDGYSFDGFEAGVDYHIGSHTSALIIIQNLRKTAWAEEETERYLDMIHEAVRNGESKIELPLGDYPDDQPYRYAREAATRASKDGFSFDDGLTHGIDYMISGIYNNNDCVRIYLFYFSE